MLRIPWTAKRTNQFVLEKINQVIQIIAKQKLSYFGHITRVEDNRLEKTIMIRMSEDKRQRGRPHLRWMDEIRNMTKLMMDELREATRDRIGWRQLIVDVTESCMT